MSSETNNATGERDPEPPRSGRFAYIAWIQAIVAVLGARAFSSAAAFLSNVLVARQLSDTVFGQFYMLFTIMSLVAGLTGPAIDTSLVRFASRRIRPGEDDSLPYFRAVLRIKLIIVLATLSAGLLAAKPLLMLLFGSAGKASIPWYAVMLAFLGGAIISLWGFAQSYFQAHQRFGWYAWFEFGSSALRLGLVVILMMLGDVSEMHYLGVYVIAPLTMAIVSWSCLPKKVFRSPHQPGVMREFLHFAKWVLLTTLFATLSQRIDVILLGVFNVPDMVIGRYSAAVCLVLVGELVWLTFFNVLLPKAGALQQPSELKRFLAQFRYPTLVFCAGLSVLIPLGGPLRELTFGPGYIGTEGYFSVLIVGVIIALASTPSIAVLYSLGHTRWITVCEAFRLACTLSMGIMAIPWYGAYGVACSVTFARVAMTVLIFWAAHRYLNRACAKFPS